MVADTHLYKQFGNSVTVPVIKALAERIKLHLDGLSDLKTEVRINKAADSNPQLVFEWS